MRQATQPGNATTALVAAWQQIEKKKRRHDGTTKTEGQYHGPTNKRVRGPYN